VTIDQAIMDANERERVNRMLQRPPGAGRATRADDVSSDESDDEVAFDPLVVVRQSSEGRMLGKWLDAARKRLKGVFPRPEARGEMEKYAMKMRERKLKGGKQKIAGVQRDAKSEASIMETRVVRLNAASAALAQRWLRAAQDSIAARFHEKGKQLRMECDAVLQHMPEEDEWFYGADLRFAGKNVITKGEGLRSDQLTLEAEAAVRIRRIEADFGAFEREKQTEIDDEREKFEQGLASVADKANFELEMRTRELERTKDARRAECDDEERRAREEEGAASGELLEHHRQIMDAIEEEIRLEQSSSEKKRRVYEMEQRGFFDRHEDLLKQVIADRRISAVTNIRQIRKETQNRIRNDESIWQNEAARWLGTAKRKVELKKREDIEAAAAKRRRNR
jgi:hypothetical protein